MDAHRLEERVAAHRAHLVAAYGGPRWDEVARAYGVSAPTARDELRAALHAVVAWAIRLEPGPGLAARLPTLADDVLAEVDGPATGAGAGLAALFANATASTAWWAERTAGDRVEVATCPGCGASQQRALAFRCGSCGGELYGGRP